MAETLLGKSSVWRAALGLEALVFDAAVVWGTVGQPPNTLEDTGVGLLVGTIPALAANVGLTACEAAKNWLDNQISDAFNQPLDGGT